MFDPKKAFGMDPARIERLRKIVHMDPPEGVPQEIVDYQIANWLHQVAIRYTRLTTSIKHTPADVEKLMVGAIDIHAHGGSDPFERILLEDELCKQYSLAGMAAVVIKTWYTPSASRNQLVNKMLQDWVERDNPPAKPVRVFGGITLNNSVGGLNPVAVQKCLGFPGMKYVWLPMVDSYHHNRVVHDNWTDSAGITLLDGNRKVKGELKEIMRICADKNLVLASGHYPYEDSIVVMEEAKKLGVKHMELIHPTHIHAKHTIKQMKEYADIGVMVMLCSLGFTCFPIHESGPIHAVDIIEKVGEDNLVFGTDYGQIHNPPHILGVRWAIQMLLSYGVSKKTVQKIFNINTAKHLDIEPVVPAID